ncbi:alpha/beta hydrolase domain-containing protein [Methylocapsa sp. S129]|uniref:alpha/beta hydrolase domain-containing protein n=1 Tax=Methylocapsa sp. S129 TaxID=1641869 RepID=UPI00131AC08E|nr:alpha/beta hydrolase domain-containing protein [Methylocapsa sp. S129]
MLHRLAAMAAATCVLTASTAEAGITRIEITKTEPAFEGRSFGAAGGFDHLVGRAYGEVDPKAPANASIQDIGLAPKNARGMVEYSTDIEILRPADPAKSNGILLFNILNRGNKGLFVPFNADEPSVVGDINRLSSPGDGWLERQGYTMIFFGWQADVLPGDGRMTFRAPVAHNDDGSPITGPVRAEFVPVAPTTTFNLSSGFFTGMTHDSYPTLNIDNRVPLADGFLPTLTMRSRETAPREPVPNTQWSFANCPNGAPPTPSDKQICMPSGFQPGKLYELIYKAKDPVVMGLGYAVTRDLGAFLKTAVKDDAGAVNPVVHGDAVKALVMGTSQSGRMIRTFLMLGFNQSEDGKQVFDAALPHIGGGLLPLSLRFAQPGRAWGEEIDHLYPAYDFPFTYGAEKDPITGRTQGILDRCAATQTCPFIIHAATALEIWEARQSLGLTDPLGLQDAVQPPNVRVYIMASTQHGPPPLPLPAKAPFGLCAQQPNPNPHTWTMRALLAALTAWVKDGREPPPSTIPRIADATLVPPDAVRFPTIPATNYGGVERPAVRYLGVVDRLHPLDFGPGYKAAETSGVISIEPPKVGSASYNILTPQVDSDGIDLAGIRDVYLQAPIGTYTGWNLFRKDRFEDGFCIFSGSFVPFAPTKAEREAAADPRPSIEERYPTKAAYVDAVKKATDALVSQRFLLEEDAERLNAEAEKDGVRTGP